MYIYIKGYKEPMVISADDIHFSNGNLIIMIYDSVVMTIPEEMIKVVTDRKITEVNNGI